jgi:predicted alpha/beta superfamily hydrolase
VASSVLGRTRNVLVYLPPGYADETSRRYPVLYFQDGQNLFDGATSFVPGEEWRLDETAERLIHAGEIEPLIVVAIDHAGRARLDEFGPVRDARHSAGGQAHLYGRMLVEEIKPLIDSEYRTRRGPNDTGLGGSSMGGLVTLHLALHSPLVFTRLAVMSPAAWWGGGAIVRQVDALAGRLPVRIWLDMGTAEGRRALRDVRALRDALIRKGWREGRDLRYVEVDGATHAEAAWGARVDQVLKFLFPSTPPRDAANHVVPAEESDAEPA